MRKPKIRTLDNVGRKRRLTYNLHCTQLYAVAYRQAQPWVSMIGFFVEFPEKFSRLKANKEFRLLGLQKMKIDVKARKLYHGRLNTIRKEKRTCSRNDLSCFRSSTLRDLAVFARQIRFDFSDHSKRFMQGRLFLETVAEIATKLFFYVWSFWGFL